MSFPSSEAAPEELVLPVIAVASALGLVTNEHVALVGGGGKSTLGHAFARQLSGRTVLTSTTKMGTDQDGGLPVLINPTDAQLTQATEASSPVMVWSGTDGTKALGVSAELCDQWFGFVDNVVVEADGARRRPFKAPRHYEPVVPATITRMVSVIGVDALGQPISDGCHRPEVVASLVGCSVHDTLTPAAAAGVLLHPQGARKELPLGVELSIVITKVGPESIDSALSLRQYLMAHELDVRVVLVEYDPTVATRDVR